jgi:hypothetical protein
MNGYRQGLLNILSRLDQCETEAGKIVRNPIYPDVFARADEMREMLVELRALVEEKLDGLSSRA